MTRDSRLYAKTTRRRLVVGAAASMLLAGGALMWIFYGPAGATLGVACMLLGVLPIGIIAGVLALLDAVVRRSR